jgi:hypothetical protein
MDRETESAGTPSAARAAGDLPHDGASVDDGAVPRRLALESMERRADDVVWLRYRVDG